MLLAAGVEPAISWSPVRRASNWAAEAGDNRVLIKAPYSSKLDILLSRKV